jgi:hypothetical protein
MKCTKCNGTGKIKAFTHICGGDCFQCNGSGFLPESKKHTMGYSKAFVKQYAGNGYFPKNQDRMVKLSAIAHIGHPTAEMQLLKEGSNYYIGQPICRSSTWFKVPNVDFELFVYHYNKTHKKTPIYIN